MLRNIFAESAKTLRHGFEFELRKLVRKQFKFDSSEKTVSIFSSDNFAKLLVSACAHLRIDFSVYLGAHAGYWIVPIRSVVREMEFLCIEANPLVYNRYKGKLSSVGGVDYQNLAVALNSGQVELKIPIRIKTPQGLCRKIDHFIFRGFHESFQREREGWETEATIVNSSTNTQIRTISVPSLSLTDIVKRIPLKNQKLLLTDLEGFDFELIQFNRNILSSFDVICFEYHFSNCSRKPEQMTLIKETLKDCGFELIAIGADSDSPVLVNLLFYKLSAGKPNSIDLIKEGASEVTLDYWQYSPSLASRLGNIPGKSLVLRLFALTGLDVFKSA